MYLVYMLLAIQATHQRHGRPTIYSFKRQVGAPLGGETCGVRASLPMELQRRRSKEGAAAAAQVWDLGAHRHP